MKMQHLLPLLALCLPLSLFGQSVVGQWTTQIPADEEGNMMDVLLDISDDGTFTVDFGLDGTIEIEGAYELAGNQMTIWDTGGNPEYMCPEGAKGVYTYSTTDTGMDMKRVSDECPGRGGPEGMSFSRK